MKIIFTPFYEFLAFFAPHYQKQFLTPQNPGPPLKYPWVRKDISKFADAKIFDYHFTTFQDKRDAMAIRIWVI